MATQEGIAQAVRALRAARLAMCATNHTLTTDRPDLPRSDETSWTIDFSDEIALIDLALGELG
ncbi:hypothetical protein ACMSSJ_11400 [Kerstersia gyiorum]|uniref:hypothetical protein n=1 Tax=Kerstersia gyiorum TaxID=206506 RepID=UPI0039EB70CD